MYRLQVCTENSYLDIEREGSQSPGKSSCIEGMYSFDNSVSEVVVYWMHVSLY